MTDQAPNDLFRVRGPVTLRGTVRISGAKNAALAAMCASLLTDDDVHLTNVPGISDATDIAELIGRLGGVGERVAPGELRLSGRGVRSTEAPRDLIKRNRASFQVMGPLLARHGHASCPMPGGDSIGQRPIDVHIDGFRALGAEVEWKGDQWVARAPSGLTGAHIFMDYPSVSGTQNVLMAAVLARGETTLANAATEPEVQDLAELLCAMGAKIRGVGTQWLHIEGVSSLKGARWAVMPDRIEAGTFAAAAAMTRGTVRIEGAPVSAMEAPIGKIQAAGARVVLSGDTVEVAPGGRLRAINLQALPFPGLATDLQAQMTAMLTQAEGTSHIFERVFDNRLLYVDEIRKMGADIKVTRTGSEAVVTGPTPLHGTRVFALDVRAGAAVLLAALVAEGTTVIEDIYHLDRGYERLEEKLRGLGVEVERIHGV
ncbi:MAG: UDP-N-acetylglucosamine 1-carboxyvinyltransferase [Dehalococcoidia bacterium]